VSIYSTLFYSADAPNGLTAAYTVPAGATVVVRDIEAYNSNASATAFSISRQVSGTTLSYIWVPSPALSASSWAQWHGRAVLNAADVLEVSTAAAGVYLHISGYLLS